MPPRRSSRRRGRRRIPLDTRRFARIRRPARARPGPAGAGTIRAGPAPPTPRGRGSAGRGRRRKGSGGSLRVPGQRAVRAPRHPGAVGRGGRDAGGRPRRRRAHRRTGGREGAGADRRARQGRRHQARRDAGRGRGAREKYPRHGHPRARRAPRVDRGGLGDPARVLRVGHLRPRRQAPAGDAVGRRRHGHRGGRALAARGAGPAARRPAGGLPALPRALAGVPRRHRRGRHQGRGRDPRQALRGLHRDRRDADGDQPAHLDRPTAG